MSVVGQWSYCSTYSNTYVHLCCLVRYPIAHSCSAHTQFVKALVRTGYKYTVANCVKYRHWARGRPRIVCYAIPGYDQGRYVWFGDQGADHGSRKDRGNKYTASDGLGVFAESPETGPSRNRLKEVGVKVTS